MLRIVLFVDIFNKKKTSQPIDATDIAVGQAPTMKLSRSRARTGLDASGSTTRNA